ALASDLSDSDRSRLFSAIRADITAEGAPHRQVERPFAVGTADAVASGWVPDADLTVGRFRGIGSVDEVLLHLLTPVATEVAADRAGRGGRRIGRSRQRAEAGDHSLPRGDDRHDRAFGHEVDERLV